MKYTKTLLTFIYLFILTSCATVKPPAEFKSNISNIMELEGVYENFGTPSYQSLWNEFCSSKIKSDDKKSYFYLKLISESKVEFSLFSNDQLIEKKEFKYKYKKGGIEIPGRANYRFQGIPLIFYRAASEALWISKENDNELFLRFEGSASGGLFFLIFGAPIKGEARFIKIRDVERSVWN